MALRKDQQVTLVENTGLEIIAPPVGEKGRVVAVQHGRALVVFGDGTVAWFDAEHDTRLSDNAIVCDLSGWNADHVMAIEQYAAEAKITPTAAVKEAVSVGLTALGWLG
jgi:hypothetical protein